jgi:alpha-1,6-mannosyltransferase
MDLERQGRDQAPNAAAATHERWMNWRRMAWLPPPTLLLELCWLGLWRAQPILTSPWALQVLFATAFLCYGWVLVLMPRLTWLHHRIQATLVLAGALAFHLTLIPAPYAGSDDIFRYVWDGRVSAAGIDPYRYPPSDPALTPLRDDAIWRPVNAKDQPSPYPPLLEAWFALVYRIQPESLVAMKAAMSLLNVGVIGVLLLLLHRRRQPLVRALIYAWNPQVIFQVAFSGHNEPLLLLCLLTTLLLGRHAGRVGRLVGAWALALATLVKVVPILVLPILLRRWGWRAAGVVLLTLGAVYGALLLQGRRVFAGLIVEGREAQFNDGLHYLVARLAQLGGPALAVPLDRVLMIVGLGAVVLGLLRQAGDDLAQPIGVIMSAYILLAASVAPWYALWVLPFVALDALPRLGRGAQQSGAAQLVGSYWLLFSWTTIFSELFYVVRRPVWIGIHVAEYAIPVCGLLGEWLWSEWRRSVAGGDCERPV